MNTKNYRMHINSACMLFKLHRSNNIFLCQKWHRTLRRDRNIPTNIGEVWSDIYNKNDIDIS